MVTAKSLKIDVEDTDKEVTIFSTNVIINVHLPHRYILIFEDTDGWTIQSENLTKLEIETRLRQYHDLISQANDQETFKNLAPCSAEPEKKDAETEVSYR